MQCLKPPVVVKNVTICLIFNKEQIDRYGNREKKVREMHYR